VVEHHLIPWNARIDKRALPSCCLSSVFFTTTAIGQDTLFVRVLTLPASSPVAPPTGIAFSSCLLKLFSWLSRIFPLNLASFFLPCYISVHLLPLKIDFLASITSPASLASLAPYHPFEPLFGAHH
jgi:hypothetical protein